MQCYYYFHFHHRPITSHRGATSLLEVLFVLVVAMAFTVGLYRQYTATSTEKTLTMLNDQVASVTQIANLFYFSVDPTTGTNNPIRFCNQTKKYFNKYLLLSDIYSYLCDPSTGKKQFCNTLNTLVNDITNETNAAHQQYYVMLGQTDGGSPKFIAIILQSTSPITKSNTILNYRIFELFKGKLVGTPRYVRIMSPFPAIRPPLRPLRYGGIVWTTPPSQGGATLFDGEKLAQTSLSAFNDLANQWWPTEQHSGYAKACQTQLFSSE